jgi:hypothetical protein
VLILRNYRCNFHSESCVESSSVSTTPRKFQNENRTSGCWE